MKLKEMIKEEHQGKNNVKSKNVTKYNPCIFPVEFSLLYLIVKIINITLSYMG